VATLQQLSEDNPNITQQYDEWRALRSERGEDASDYQAFRQHVMTIGAPDPGEDEPEDFTDSSFKAAHPERYDTSSA
jgi:hypothetical protein